MNTFNLTLDLNKGKVTTPIRIRQGDLDGTTIHALILDHGASVDLTGLTAAFVMELPGGEHYYRKTATVGDGTVDVTINEVQAASVTGRTTRAYFQFFEGSTMRASTGSVTVDILPDALEGHTVPEDYDSAIQDAIDALDDAVEHIADTVEDVLEDHPEWTTTVQDHSITERKLYNQFLLTAGAALGITGDGPTETAAWLQRTSTSDGPTTAKSIHGRTLRWNQLAARRFTDVRESNGITFDFTVEGVISISGTATADVNFVLFPYVSVTAGHKYLALGQVENANITASTTYAVTLTNSAAFGGVSLKIPAGGMIVTCTSDATNINATMYVKNGTVLPNTLHSRPQFFDLTAMFGAGLEPATIAEFEALYSEPYYEYNAGSLLPVSMTGIETTGFNQLDPANVRTDIFINGSTGVVSAASWAQTAIIEVFPNTDYCLTYTGGNRCIIAGVDSMTPAVGDPAWTIFNGGSSRVSPKVFNTGANRYIACYVATSAAPASDICVNLSDPTRNGTYEPYWHQERTIPAGTLRSAGSVYDELTETERITRIGERAYQSGDESDATVVTDGTATYYPLATPTTTPIDPPLNLTYRTEQGGTERVMVPTGELSAPPTLVTAQGYTAESLRDAALSAIAPVENGLASTNYGVGSYLVHGGQLCKVTTAIATGEAINIGTNVITTTVMAEVLSITQ